MARILPSAAARGRYFIPQSGAITSRSAGRYGYARRTRAALLAALWAGRQESGMAFAAIAGVTPSYKNIVTSAEFQTTFKQDNEMWPFHEVLPNAVPRPNFPAYDRAVALVDTQLGAIWAGKISVDDGLKEAERQGQQLLDEALRSS